MSGPKRAVILVGHGGIPNDRPRELLMRLKEMEGQRRVTGASPTAAEIELDRRIRRWPRTTETDPYAAGLQALAARLRPLLDGTPLVLAYNEYCAPSLEEAAGELIKAGVAEIVVMPSMATPGGSHSEIEIPQTLDRLRAAHAGVTFRYAWPFDLDLVAGMFAEHLRKVLG